MPRCSSRMPSSRSSSRYLPRRRTPCTVRPCSSWGSTPRGQRSGLPSRTSWMRAPAMRSAKLRRVTSTSGSSGICWRWEAWLIMVWMKSRLRFLQGAVLLLALAQAGMAQTAATDTTEPPPKPSALDAELFYELLLGELNVQGTEPSAGFALVLDAARRTNDPALYQRAVEIAFQGRSGDAALQAARAWKQAFPDSREANRYVLQILLALNRVTESAEPLKAELALADPKERGAVLGAVPRLYARVSDKKLATNVVEQALAEAVAQPATAAAAWTTIGRVRLAAGDDAGALDAANRGQAADPKAEAPVLLGLELMDPKQPQAEAIVRRYIDDKPLPELRMGYARALLDVQRYSEARQQLQQVTREKPELAEAWLALGTLQMQ